ncbi:hypothetical protein NFHSH190041_00740 [Shewanella sp. NFH-SH190041]|uniref:NirD/YgiW/YdeI family stress tolerance protein n=1 Tax=Shewanella sp. NFH-SH190041 TaxID=2950245 RepID=UPI0021C449E3|nr:NirD/YgiW/YdeI family stress tolerance protein [Shewanella sp. NFH-SH190041]BDM62622.1 hypothetical protein NFHSH190041_00740 [Shewanella sp. NFH-SH190041]
MSKKISAAFLLASLFAGSAMAAYNGPATVAPVTDAQSAQQAKDGAKAQLTGKIVKSLGDEKYVFQDGTGEITVDIDNDLLTNINFDENTPVVLIGEVDNDWNSQEVEVDTISLVPTNAVQTPQAKK